MRLMNWNIEHMNSWWEGGENDPAIMRPTFAGNNFSPAITDVPALAQRVGQVISDVDPDVLSIQEGPGVLEMDQFLDQFVDGDTWQIRRGSGGGQALVVAARMDRVDAFDDGSSVAGTIDLSQNFTADVNADLEFDDVAFARRPQVVNITASGNQITLINNHLKSKFVSNAETLFNAGGDDRKQFFAAALIARRRISGEAYRIRLFVDQVLLADPAAQVIVVGDLNDGPGSDFFEENFLTHSVVDRIFGSVFHRDRQLTHVLLHGDSTDFTAQFFDFIAGETRDLILDHIGLSPGILENWTWQGRVAVAEFEAQILNDNTLNERDRQPSDHRPVVVDLTPVP